MLSYASALGSINAMIHTHDRRSLYSEVRKTGHEIIGQGDVSPCT